MTFKVYQCDHFTPFIYSHMFFHYDLIVEFKVVNHNENNNKIEINILIKN